MEEYEEYMEEHRFVFALKLVAIEPIVPFDIVNLQSTNLINSSSHLPR